MEEQMMDWEEVPVSSQRNELLIPAIERLPEQSRKVLQMRLLLMNYQYLSVQLRLFYIK